MIFGFVAFVFLVVVGVHLYLWKRLVRDTAPRGRARTVAGFAVLVLALLVPATLIGTRTGYLSWLAWPGFLWLALMFYLLVVLVILEIPRLVISLMWRASDRKATDRDLVTARRGAADGTTHADPVLGDEPGDTLTAPRTGHPDLDQPTDRQSAADKATTGGPAADKARAGGQSADKARKSGPAADKARTGGPAADRARTSGPAGDASQTGGSAEDDAEAATGREPGSKPDGVERRLLLARGAAIFAGLTAAGITGYGVRTALGPPQLDRVQIPIAKLPRAMDGTRLAVVSDIHLGPLTSSRHMARIVETINSTDADIVCIVGDMVDGTVEELGAGAAPLRDIRSRQGAYFVTGNHEYYSGFQQWVDEVARLGVRPLRNDRVEIVTRGGAFDLAGVNDLGGAEFNDAPDFEAALGRRDTAKPVVLMAHQPVVAHDAARYGVDLQVSGHTHGGQMVPFNFLVGVEQPVVSGYGEVDGVPVYVTNGAGFWGPPVRVGAPPQVTLIELRAP